MKHTKSLLDRATDALRTDVPNADALATSVQRTAHRLGIDGASEGVQAIENCEGIRFLLNAYRAGALPEPRRLMVEWHLRECGPCLHLLREGSHAVVVDWSAPPVAKRAPRSPRMLGWGLAFASMAVLTAIFLYRAYWQVPPGVRAEVQSVDGAAYLISDNVDRPIASGAALHEGEQLRTAADSRATVRLADGSLVQINQRSTLSVRARGRDMTVALDRGAVIVEAAHRTSGHLYVHTPDCRVAVTGTIFSVDAGLKGSRVGVLQGSVQVSHAGLHPVLHPGEQFATSDNLAPEPLQEQFAWSADQQKYVGIMAQLALVEHRIAELPFPEPRSSSDLLPRMPANTLLYVSIPNLGEFLNEANRIFQDQLNQSPDLQEWWSHGQTRNKQDLNEFVGEIHDISQYLGDEVVLAGINGADHPTIAVIADVQHSGLKEELQHQFTTSTGGLTVLDPASLAASAGAVGDRGGYALVRDHEVIFAGTIDALKLFNTSLDAGASGFASNAFGSQIAAAYTRGAGILLAADLHSMLQSRMTHTPREAAKQRQLEATGLADVQYLIAEHRERNGIPANHLNLQFAGTRQRVASWLGSPAPMGSLDFVSPNASIAVATLTKYPASIADDLIVMASQAKNPVDLNEVDAKLQISVRNDLMVNLGGDFLIAFDGPALPTPAWKIVIEVNNPVALESALERMTKAIDGEMRDPKTHPVTIEGETANGQQYYTIRDQVTGAALAQYTYADGFMIVAPERAQLIEALHTHDNGNSLARSAAFRALLPHDANENYSAVVYQNLKPALSPLLSQFSGEAADTLRKLASDSRPTVICAWGQDNRIEAATDSRLFGFDFLTLGAILDTRNKSAAQHVAN
jgi:hypothetical protein